MPSLCIEIREVVGDTISPTFASIRVTTPVNGAVIYVLARADCAFATTALCATIESSVEPACLSARFFRAESRVVIAVVRADTELFTEVRAVASVVMYEERVEAEVVWSGIPWFRAELESASRAVTCARYD